MVNTGLNVSYDFGRMLFTSTTSHQYLWDKMNMDQDYMPVDFMQLMQVEKMNAVTQEFALRSKNGSWWQHVTGLFGSYQWLSTTAPVVFGAGMKQMIAARVKPIMESMGAGIKFSVFQIPDFYIDEYFKTPTFNAGAFHESTFALTDRFEMKLGLRYDYQNVKADYVTDGLFSLHFVIPPTYSPNEYSVANKLTSEMDGSTRQSFHQLLPKLGLMYRIDDNNSNVYATVSKGYRAGGFNIQMFSDILQTEFMKNAMVLRYPADVSLTHTAADYDNVNNTISYKPETSWNYEAGTHLNLFGGKLHADFSVFYMQIHNQQLSVMAGQYGYGRMMVNAGKSSSCGLELALRGSALDNQISWALSYSFTHSTFRQYTDSISVNGAKQAVDYKGKNVPFVPQHTFSALADYRFGLCRDGFLKAVTLGVNVNGNGKTYWDIDNTLSQKLYAVLGAHVNFDFGCCSLDIWGRNLTNTKYNTFLVSNTFGNTVSSFAQLGNPVQIGADVRFHF
jgi:outer membrane receptor protein involved in Fe transport